MSANRSETTRRMAPTLVNVMDVKVFENTNSSTLSQGLNFQPECGSRIIVRTVVSSKYVSMGWMALIRRY